jgi:diacylglycerol kinase family enzyme
MAHTNDTRPSTGRRAAAVLSLVATACLAVALVVILVSRLPALLLGAVGLGFVVAGLWWTVTERMPRRAVGIAGLLLGLGVIAGSVVLVSDDLDGIGRRALAILALAAAAGVFARIALVDELHEGDQDVVLFTPRRPVLLYNEKSGGGKVGSFGLLDIAADMDVETVALTPGDDLAQLARDAVERGADCLGMAGGDGSQALVASVAVEHDLPFVVIPAGTRNHFALDLGLDRDDPRTAMQAFRQGAVRHIDYATAGDRLFVNNVSLGVYATIVQRDDYRDAKLATSRDLLPDLVGRSADAFDLQFTAADGSEVDDVFLILVSNNPYSIGPSLRSSQRPSLTTGRLGIVAARARSGADAVTVLAEATLHLNTGVRGLIQFQAKDFEVRSHSGHAYAGIDGEALDVDTPLRFRMHPRSLTLLVPPDRAHGPRPTGARAVRVRDLTDIALGRG